MQVISIVNYYLINVMKCRNMVLSSSFIICVDTSLSVGSLLEMTEGFTKWLELGQLLDIPHEELENIKQQKNDDMTDILDQIFSKWLIIDKDPSWKTLATSFIYLQETELSMKAERYDKLGRYQS